MECLYLSSLYRSESQVAIDLPFILTSGNIPIVLLDPDNIVVSSFVDIVIKADIYVVLIYFRQQQAAIFDFTLILTSNKVVTSPGVLRDPKNMSIVAGISLLSW